MARYVLVHGAWHGSWAWEQLSPLLLDAGHDAVAVDLPISDPTATFETYADVVVDAMADRDDAVLVAHSLGGIPSTIAALRRPVAALVYVCGVLPKVAGMPNEGEPVQAEDAVFAALRRNDDGSNEWADDAAAVAALYADCPADLADRAVRRLRPQQTAIWRNNPVLPSWPAFPLTYVACADDVVVRAEWARWAARNWLGVEPVELPGDHSPMLSRPAALAEVLRAIASE
jgi:pimeloyl-ACP methyl ester carboxylesterase